MSRIRFENVNKSFGSLHVLKDISLEVEDGDLATLLGPSGCGKSTLLRCLAGLEEVSSGRIYMDDVDITDESPKNRGIGMVFQQYSLFPNMTAAQNVAFGLTLKKIPKEDIKRHVDEILEVVGLSQHRGHYPAQLSGGQQQRVALARAIVTNPKVLLLDEPLSAIDAKLRRNLQIEIRRIQREFHITTIFVTHDQDEAMVMSDQIHLFNEGCIEQSGTPADLYTHPVSKFSAGFIGSYNILPTEAFNRLFGTSLACENVAIRPEVIAIGMDTDAGTENYRVQGRIANSLSHGNILRYTVECGGVPINADIMFDRNVLLQIGEEVWLTVRKDNVIELTR